MAFTFEITSTPGCAVLALKGRIISDELIADIVQQVEKEVVAGQKNWICDASGLEYCNSLGLNLFIRVLTRSRNAGGDCAVVNLQPGVKKLFELSKLNQIFTAFDSVEDAKARYNTVQ